MLIGGAAIQSHGGSYDTQDIDLAPETGDASLQRLCDAVNELRCQLVTDLANTAAWVTLPDDYSHPAASGRRASGTSPPATGSLT